MDEPQLMKKKLLYFSGSLIFAVCLCFPLLLQAQSCHTIKGTISDITNGEKLAGVRVSVLAEETGTYSDQDGKYSLLLPEGAHTLVFSLTTYTTLEVDIELTADMESSYYLVEEAEIKSELVHRGSGKQSYILEQDTPAVVRLVNQLIRIFTKQIWE
jgi:hypothetical protein